MKLRLGWLNQPYLIILVALMALGFAIAGTTAGDADTPNPTDRHVIHSDRPDALTDFLIGHGWEEPPAPGDLTPIRVQAGQGILAAPSHR